MRSKQKGAVLIMSLLILMIMTLLGTHALKTSALDMKIIANNQESNTVFHVAESALEMAVDLEVVADRAPFDAAIAADSNEATVDKSSDLNMSGTEAQVTIFFDEANSVYAVPPGATVGVFTSARFIVSGSALRKGSHAKTTHRRGLEIVSPAG
jgi:type IV pilus assembly protein PilX